MSSTFRAIRPDERALLERRARWMVPRRRDAIISTFLTVLFIWMVLLFAGELLLPRFADIENAYMVSTLIATIAMLTFRFYRKRTSDKVRALARKERAAALLAEYRAIEQVEDWHIHIVDAIQVEIDDDIGSQYYLEMEDGRVLVLDEAWLQRDDEDDPYAPNRELIVTRLLPPRESTIIGVQNVGAYFTPSHVRETTAAEWTANAIRNNGDILPGPLSRYIEPAILDHT